MTRTPSEPAHLGSGSGGGLNTEASLEQLFADLFNGDAQLHAKFDAEGLLDFDKKVWLKRYFLWFDDKCESIYIHQGGVSSVYILLWGSSSFVSTNRTETTVCSSVFDKYTLMIGTSLRVK